MKPWNGKISGGIAALAIATVAHAGLILENPQLTTAVKFTDTSGALNKITMSDAASYVSIPLGSGTANRVAIEGANQTQAKVIISAGTVSVLDNSGTGAAGIMRLIGNGTYANLSGGTFSLDERQAGNAEGYFLNWGAQLNISGGSHDFKTNDDVGNSYAFRILNGADATISGGIFSSDANFDTDFRIEDSSTVSLKVLNFSGVTLDGNGDVSTANGTISGQLGDGNAFSFDFNTIDSAKINVEVIPEPATLGLFGVFSGLILAARRIGLV